MQRAAAAQVFMQKYFLARHVYVCAIGPDVIVLDLRQDKYLAFRREFWDPIARLIGGWPMDPNADPHDSLEQADENVLAQLLERGLLTMDGEQGKDASPAAMQPPLNSFLEDFRSKRPTIRASHVFVFLYAILTALVKLRFQSMESIVRSARRRRQHPDAMHDLATMRDLTEIFRRLRPLLFSSRDHCLFESLTLGQFLSHYKIHPTWVFAVRTTPFIAHCWLQQGETACNDKLDHIRRYTPIMLV